jgi:hypothetical protein
MILWTSPFTGKTVTLIGGGSQGRTVCKAPERGCSFRLKKGTEERYRTPFRA